MRSARTGEEKPQRAIIEKCVCGWQPKDLFIIKQNTLYCRTMECFRWASAADLLCTDVKTSPSRPFPQHSQPVSQHPPTHQKRHQNQKQVKGDPCSFVSRVKCHVGGSVFAVFFFFLFCMASERVACGGYASPIPTPPDVEVSWRWLQIERGKSFAWRHRQAEVSGQLKGKAQDSSSNIGSRVVGSVNVMARYVRYVSNLSCK